MACYPLILLIVGLNPNDLSVEWSDTLKNLIKDCKTDSTNSLDLYPTWPPVELTTLPPSTSPPPTTKEAITWGPWWDSDWKVWLPTTPRTDPLPDILPLSSNLQDKAAEIPTLVIKEKTDGKKEKIDKSVVDEKKAVRIGKRVKKIRIPAADDVNKLVAAFKTKSRAVAVSDKLLKSLTDHRGEWNKRDPYVLGLYPETNKRPRYIGLSKNYLAKLIAEKVRKVKKIGSKVLDPFGLLTKFKNVIHAVFDYLGRDETLDYYNPIAVDEIDYDFAVPYSNSRQQLYKKRHS